MPCQKVVCFWSTACQQSNSRAHASKTNATTSESLNSADIRPRAESLNSADIRSQSCDIRSQSCDIRPRAVMQSAKTGMPTDIQRCCCVQRTLHSPPGVCSCQTMNHHHGGARLVSSTSDSTHMCNRPDHQRSSMVPLDSTQMWIQTRHECVMMQHPGVMIVRKEAPSGSPLEAL